MYSHLTGYCLLRLGRGVASTTPHAPTVVVPASVEPIVKTKTCTVDNKGQTEQTH